MILKRNTNPDLIKETKEDYKDYIESGLLEKEVDPSLRQIIEKLKGIEKTKKIQFREDLYRYIKFLSRFYYKNNPTWYNSFKLCEGEEFIVPFLEFNEIFPIPSPDFDQDEWHIKILGSLNGEGIIVEFDEPNRVYQFRHNPPPKGQTYANLKDILKDIVLWSTQDMKKGKFYKTYPQIYRTHKGIIDEFLRGLRTL